MNENVRRIEIMIDDTGVAEVKIDANKNGQFLTKREFNRALRAAQLKYRQAIREYRRQKTITNFVKEAENANKQKRIESRPEPESIEAKSESVGGVSNIESSSERFARAVAATEKRRRIDEAKRRSGQNAKESGSAGAGSGFAPHTQ